MAHSVHTHLARTASRGGDIHTPAGTLIPEAEVRTRRVAREAGRWRAFAGERTRMQPATLDAKALDGCAFSVHHRASSFAVPSKLVGTSRHQPALRALSQASNTCWLTLDLDARGEHLVVSLGGRVLGRVQPKHLGWVRPLIPFGLTVHLSRVTGAGAATPRRAYCLGCNVAFGHVGAALDKLASVLADPGGDGAVRSGLRLVVSPAPEDRITFPVGPEHEGLTSDAKDLSEKSAWEKEDERTEAEQGARSSRCLSIGDGARRRAAYVQPTDAERAFRIGPVDVVLWRTAEGEARASVPHAVRHSPTGIEWGYTGSGPADLARSVLLALTDAPTADTFYQRFKHEVVAALPPNGGVLNAADVRAWVRRQAA